MLAHMAIPTERFAFAGSNSAPPRETGTHVVALKPFPGEPAPATAPAVTLEDSPTEARTPEVRECGPAVSSGSADEREVDFTCRARAVQRREPGSNHGRAAQVNPRYRFRFVDRRIARHVTAQGAGCL